MASLVKDFFKLFDDGRPDYEEPNNARSGLARDFGLLMPHYYTV